jgi:hypothetical protein
MQGAKQEDKEAISYASQLRLSYLDLDETNLPAYTSSSPGSDKIPSEVGTRPPAP